MADQMDSPNNANWVLNSFASVSADSSNNSLVVRRFDDTTAEGVGMLIVTPPSPSTNLVLTLTSRAQTAVPSGTRSAIGKLYARSISTTPAAIGSWNAATITGIDFTNNTFWVYDSSTIAYSTLGMAVNQATQLELIRDATQAADNLVGDWVLLAAKITFS
jgi:hypothetical protein